MQFNGRSVERYKGVVHIVRETEGVLEDFQIRIKQLPATWERDAQRVLPEPVPPVVGKVFDGAGKESPKYGHDDPAYVRSRELWEDRRTALKIRDATIDEGITWQTPVELRQTDIGAYCDALFAELVDAFSRGELSRWVLTINTIDAVGGADIALAEEGLLPVIQRLVQLSQLEAVPVEGE